MEFNFISNQIKNISIQDVDVDMHKLINIANDIKPLCRVGNKVIDYFTFSERLKTRGGMNINYYEFVERIDEFKNKHYIQTILNFYNNKSRKQNDYIIYYKVFNLCISAISIMKPVNCVGLFKKYNSRRVLNPCAGWGGSTVACASLNLEACYGVEINHDLEPCYDKMISYLKTKCETEFDIKFQDALTVDYVAMNYDTVFCSPPYYKLEKYPNNLFYKTKIEMNKLFYEPLFSKTYAGLKLNGYYIINVCAEVYETVLIKLFGEADFIETLNKSIRAKKYNEFIYCWLKKEA